MEDLKSLTIHFNSGEMLSFTFPRQIEDAYIAAAVKNLLKDEKLVIEAGGSVFVFPWSNIRYIKVSPPPAELPLLTIRNADLCG